MSNLNAQQWYDRLTNDGISSLEVWAIIEDLRKRENEITKLESRIAEREAEQRWVPVREFPSQQGWYRVITNSGLEQVRQYKCESERDICYWMCEDNEWIMMYTNPPLPHPPKDGSQ